jgi:hypothetical protein
MIRRMNMREAMMRESSRKISAYNFIEILVGKGDDDYMDEISSDSGLSLDLIDKIQSSCRIVTSHEQFAVHDNVTLLKPRPGMAYAIVDDEDVTIIEGPVELLRLIK